MASDSSIERPLLSVVVPVYNEEENIEPLLARALPVLARIDGESELLFVDDGSTDASADRIRQFAAVHPQVRLLRLARNFGHQAALFAGLEHARGEAVITLDGDLQHPPELMLELVARWREGFEVVQAVRRAPADESVIKRAGSSGFYRLLSRVSRIAVTPGAADFRLLSRVAVDAFLACRERSRFNRGLVQWIGFRQTQVYYDAERRRSGRSKYSYRAMVRLAGDAIFSFSALPLRLAGLAGVCVSICAAAYLLFVLWARLFTDRAEPGWSSILATVLVLGGVQLIVLWILGEYVGRLYEEAKQRPIYIVRESGAAQRGAAPMDASKSETESGVATSVPRELPHAHED